MPGIGIIANPHSKLNKRSPHELQRLQDIMSQKGVFTITRDLDHLDETLLLYKEQNLPIVAINGGDGTVSQTLTRMIRLYGQQPLPQIAVLRGGTMNLIAAQLGVRGQPDALLERLVEMLEKGQAPKVEHLSTLKIGAAYGFLYADQSSTRILEEFYSDKSGHVGASLLALRLVCSSLLQGRFIREMIHAHPLQALLKPGGQLKTPALGCFAGTITKFPMGLVFLPLARKKAGHFQTTIVTCKAEKILWYLPLIMLQHKEGPAIGKHSFCCEQAVLQYEGEVHYTIDGEIYRNPDGRVVIESGPSIPFVRF
jgi:diacylglycerol kinase (ATP)